MYWGRWLSAPVFPLSDVYAAASVLYQLMEGHSPYDLSFAGRTASAKAGLPTASRRSSRPRRPPVPTGAPQMFARCSLRSPR